MLMQVARLLQVKDIQVAAIYLLLADHTVVVVAELEAQVLPVD
jgi:hypothetical protein